MKKKNEKGAPTGVPNPSLKIKDVYICYILALSYLYIYPVADAGGRETRSITNEITMAFIHSFCPARAETINYT